MSQAHPRIYISHAWGGESEDIVQGVVRVFDRAGLPVIYDKKDLGYRQSIQEFMVNLGQADIIIIVVSNKYLHSEYCMFELLQIYDNNRVLDRIFPIVLEEVDIAKSTQRLELVKYWEQETKQLEQKIRELESITYIEGISEDLNLYQTIRNRIARLTAILKDINTLNIQLHQESDYTDLLAAVRQKLAASRESAAPSSSTGQPPPIYHREEPSRKRRFPWPWILTAVIGILALSLSGWWPFAGEEHSDSPAELAQMDSGSEHLPEETAEDQGAPTRTQEMARNTPEQVGNTALEQPVRTTPSQKKVDFSPPPAEQKKEVPPPVKKPVPSPEKTSAMPVEESATSDLQSGNESPPPRALDITIPRQMIRVVLATTISSDRSRTGDEVQLTSLDEVQVGPHQVIRPGAMIRAEVTRAESSLNKVKGALAFRIKDVQTTDGQWLDLSYPEYSDSRRGEVVFPKGTELANVVLKEARILWTPDQ